MSAAIAGGHPEDGDIDCVFTGEAEADSGDREEMLPCVEQKNTRLDIYSKVNQGHWSSH